LNGTPLEAHHTNVKARKTGYNPTLFGYTDTTLDQGKFPADD
jgi:hypothetical protein